MMIRREILMSLRGVFPPVVTPFDRRGQIDSGAFCENLRRYTGVGLSGILIAGSTGEAPYLTDRERLRLIELGRRIITPPALLLVGTGLESTRETLRLSREAAKRGADVLLVLTPNYYKSRMDSDALTCHYRSLADRLPRPLMIYNIPQFTGIRMDPATIGALSRHPNIYGIKESSGDLAYLQAILRRVPRRFRVFTGSGAIFLDALQAGAAGGILGQACFTPEICVGLYDAFTRRRRKLATELQSRLQVLVQEISVPHGVPGIKAALDLAGYLGRLPRPPLLALSEAGRRVVAAALEKSRAGLDF